MRECMQKANYYTSPRLFPRVDGRKINNERDKITKVFLRPWRNSLSNLNSSAYCSTNSILAQFTPPPRPSSSVGRVKENGKSLLIYVTFCRCALAVSETATSKSESGWRSRRKRNVLLILNLLLKFSGRFMNRDGREKTGEIRMRQEKSSGEKLFPLFFAGLIACWLLF